MTKTSNQASWRLIIVGGGMVCRYFLQKAVQLGLHKQAFISVFCEEDLPPYDRIHLTEAFDDLNANKLFLSPSEWYIQNGIRLYTNSRVLGIDFEKRRVRVGIKGEFQYDKLIFATGSRPFIPPIEGVDHPDIFFYRNFADLKRIQNTSLKAQKSAVIGGGLLGLEAARALKKNQAEVHLLEYAAYLLPKQLQPESAELLKNLVEEKGIKVHLEAQTKAVRKVGSALAIDLKNKPSLEVDLIVIAAGVIPRDELAHISGLKVDLGGGIEVDSNLLSSDPNVFAMGDCVSYKGQRFGLAAPGFQMAEIIAQQLAGRSHRPFRIPQGDTSLKFAGIDLSVIGDYRRPNSERYTWSTSKFYRQIVCKGERIVGLVHVGEWDEVPQIQEIIQSKTRIGEHSFSEFSTTGKLLSEEERNAPLHANTIICNCMKISKGTLDTHIAAGCNTVEQIGLKCGAGMVCGSCKPAIAKLCNDEVHIVESGKSLALTLLSSFTAALLLLSFLVIPQLSHIQSVLDPAYKFQIWWRDSFLQQISGFVAGGLMVLALLLSLRKRFRFFQFGKFSLWRGAHAVLSILSLLAYLFHSGNHFGHGLNFLLACNFIAMQITGVFAGVHIGILGDTLSSAQRKQRNFLINLHLFLFLFLPAFLSLHILLSYLY